MTTRGGADPFLPAAAASSSSATTATSSASSSSTTLTLLAALIAAAWLLCEAPRCIAVGYSYTRFVGPVVGPEERVYVRDDYNGDARLDYVAQPAYEFAYGVEDGEMRLLQNRKETRHGDAVKGVYSVVDPDGTLRVVKYVADDTNGFRAEVITNGVTTLHGHVGENDVPPQELHVRHEPNHPQPAEGGSHDAVRPAYEVHENDGNGDNDDADDDDDAADDTDGDGDDESDAHASAADDPDDDSGNSASEEQSDAYYDDSSQETDEDEATHS